MNSAVVALRNGLKIPELRQRMVFTLVIVAVYRIGAQIPAPGINGNALSDLATGMNQGMLGFYNLFTGSALEQASIFSLGIMPYISASIIMQLLTVVIPQFEQLAKSGAEGYKKINEYTRYGTILLGIIQSIGIAFLLIRMNNEAGVKFIMLPSWGFVLLCIVTFTTGTAFIMWLGEQISEYGIGNGMSMLIFVSIISQFPSTMAILFQMFRNDQVNVIQILLLFVSLAAVVAGVIFVTTAQRRVPVQYPRQVRGRRVVQGSRNYLPLRVNQAGVIPIIFASSILMLPQFLANAINVDVVTAFFNNNFGHDDALYILAYGLLIFFFSYFYTAITFNPIDQADNLKKSGGVIVGVRPGKATADYLNNVMVRITLVGGFFLVVVAIIPTIVYKYMAVYDWQVAQFFGGTSLLILVGVGLDTVRQIETHLVMRNYDGFMKGRRIKGRRNF